MHESFAERLNDAIRRQDDDCVSDGILDGGSSENRASRVGYMEMCHGDCCFGGLVVQLAFHQHD